MVAGTGPGPYTGLRVGLVTAAAFADAVGVPTYGVCSLDAIAAACADEPALLVVTDARRREVYWAHYEYGRRMGTPAVCAPAEIPLDGVSAVAGAGGELYRELWPRPAAPARALPRRPRARQLRRATGSRGRAPGRAAHPAVPAPPRRRRARRARRR